MSRTFQLVPLRVPAGSVVVHNGFFAVDLQSDAMPASTRATYLVEDLLYIRAENRDAHIDLGWTPDMDLTGAYHLAVHQGDERAPVEEYASRSYPEIAAQIERCLAPQGQRAACAALIPLRIVSGWHVAHNAFTEDPAADPADGNRPMRVLHLRKPSYGMEDIAITLDMLPRTLAYQLTITRAEDAAPLKTYQSASIERIVAALEQWIAVAHRLWGDHAADMLAPNDFG